MRISSQPGAAAMGQDQAQRLTDVWRQVLATVRQAGILPAEIQIDYDCATARLGAYRTWIASLRGDLPPCRLVVTALPDWLRAPQFRGLADAVDGYVLQVHSVERPQGLKPATLCDGARAIRWIRQAQLLGRPFRVALPDYGYRMGFTSSGRLAGIEAEGMERDWPADLTVRTVMADPAEIASVVRFIGAHPGGGLAGVACFRLPMPGDDLTWPAPTWEAVRRGLTPGGKLELQIAAAADGAEDLFIANRGNGPSPLTGLAMPLAATRPLAWELTAEWRALPEADGTMQLLPTETAAEPLPAGERRRIGWIRYAAPP